MVKPAAKRLIVDYLCEVYPLSIRQACLLIAFHRSMYYYQSRKKADTEVIDALEALAERHPTYGFKKMFQSIRLEGHRWNHKKVYRVYKALGLNLRRKRKKRLPSLDPTPLVIPEQADEVWSMDFMSDSLTNGRRFRTFNVMDHYNREVLWIEVGWSLPSQRLIGILDWLIDQRKAPSALRVDNGPEFRSGLFEAWARQRGIQLDFIEPGKPTQPTKGSSAQLKCLDRTLKPNLSNRNLRCLSV